MLEVYRMATPAVQFEDPIQQAKSHEQQAISSSIENPGIVFSRTRSHGSFSTRRVSRRRSTKSPDDDDPEKTGLRRAGDYKTRQVFRGKQLLFLAYQSIGVIYGDIGTSPLYVFSSTFVDTKPTRANVRS